MKKTTVNLPKPVWGSTKTKWTSDNARVSLNDFTKGTINHQTDVNGNLTKRPDGSLYNPSHLLPTPGVDGYEAVFDDGTHHLLAVENGNLRYSAGNGQFNLVTAGYNAVSNFEFAKIKNRIYFGNGVDNPQVYDKVSNYGGVTYTVPKTKPMGLHPPATAPVATLLVDSTTNQVPAGNHTYKVTFVYYNGEEESNGGTASNVVTNDATHTSNSVTLAIGEYGVTARNIYRDDNDGNWLLVDTVGNNTATTFTDVSPTTTVPIPIINNLPPQFSLIVTWHDRTWVALLGTSILFFSEAGQPDVFPSDNFIDTNPSSPIYGLAVYYDQIFVMNKENMGQIIGSQPSDFAYSDIPGSFGCTDNRSIQIRTINSVPMLMWLSQKGFYGYNGASFTYLSEDIEDLVNFNIKQGQLTKGRNFQDTEVDFLAGTASPGIDLVDNPGFIQTINPKKLFSKQSDWEVAGATRTNIATRSNPDDLAIPLSKLFARNDVGAILSGVQLDGSGNLVLPTQSGFTGEDAGSSAGYQPIDFGPGFNASEIWQPIVPPVSGILNNFHFNVVAGSGGTFAMQIRADNAGLPTGTVLFSSNITIAGGAGANISANPNVFLNAGTKYWYGLVNVSSGNLTQVQAGSLFLSGGQPVKRGGSGPSYQTVSFFSLFGGYTFTHSPVPNSGSYISTTYDCGSLVPSPANIIVSITYPTGTGATLTLDGSVHPDFSTIDSTQTLVNPNGTVSLSLTGVRYWRVTLNLTTTDNRLTPLVTTDINLTFATTSTWISGAIDMTTDITALGTLTDTTVLPSGTTVTLTIATSPDNITYTAFTNIGSATVQRYAKVKAVLTTPSTTVTPLVTSITLTWTLTSNFISSIIDTGVNPPAGWDIFQSSFLLNGGTVSFFMRSASSSGGIPAATFFAVTNGQFPNSVTPNEFTQWKIVLTSTADNVPEVDNVTIGWLISATQALRVTSLFYNLTYFIAVNDFSKAVNNLILTYDREGNWRIWQDQDVNVFVMFFDKPYFYSADDGSVVQFLTGTRGNTITMDIRTKAFGADGTDIKRTKIFRKGYVSGINTGAVYQFFFSVDNGNTWIPLKVQTANGNTTLTTVNDGTRFVHRLIPDFSMANNSGKTVMFRIFESSVNAATIDGIELDIWVREGELLTSTPT